MARQVPRRTVTVPVTYEIHPKHRNRTPGASQWTVSEEDEVATFERARERNWLLSAHGWGLHVPNDVAAYCGTAQDHRTPAFLAKFVDDTRSNVWHGYPTLNDHRDNRPPDAVVADWLAMDLLKPVVIRRLAKGQPCSL